jgi:hypothetical protein
MALLGSLVLGLLTVFYGLLTASIFAGILGLFTQYGACAASSPIPVSTR